HVHSMFLCFILFFTAPAPTAIYTLSLHDALPIFTSLRLAVRALRRNTLRTALTMLGMIIGVGAVVTMVALGNGAQNTVEQDVRRSEEHTSELQSPCNLVCRLLLEKKKNKKNQLIE